MSKENVTGRAIEKDAERVASTYDECAAVYAAERADTARELGRDEAARHWSAVEQELTEEDDEYCR